MRAQLLLEPAPLLHHTYTRAQRIYDFAIFSLHYSRGAHVAIARIFPLPRCARAYITRVNETVISKNSRWGVAISSHLCVLYTPCRIKAILFKSNKDGSENLFPGRSRAQLAAVRSALSAQLNRTELLARGHPPAPIVKRLERRKLLYGTRRVFGYRGDRLAGVFRLGETLLLSARARLDF